VCVSAVGMNLTAGAADDARVIDASGKLVIPGELSHKSNELLLILYVCILRAYFLAHRIGVALNELMCLSCGHCSFGVNWLVLRQ